VTFGVAMDYAFKAILVFLLLSIILLGD